METSSVPSTAREPSGSARRFPGSGQDAVKRLRETSARLPLFQIVAMVALFLYGAATISGYASHASIVSMLVLASFLGIAAGGQTIVALIGELDLSLAAVISAANVAVCNLNGDHWSIVVNLVVVILGAGVIGGINGWLIYRFELPSLIVTLGSGSLIGGAILVWTKGATAGASPAWLGRLDSPIEKTFGFLGVPPVIIIWACVALLIVVVLNKTAMGRKLYAVGANKQAARLSLVRTQRIYIGAFAACSAIAGITGILLAGFTSTGVFNIGDQYLFMTVAAVVVGGTSLLGARGDYIRTILGALILTQVSTLLVGYGVDVTQMVTGGAIIAVVVIYGRETHMRNRI